MSKVKTNTKINAKNTADIKKIKANIAKIQKVIDKQGKYSYYLITDDGNDVKLMSKGNNKEDAENVILEKISNKKRYVKDFIYSVEIYINERYVDNPHRLVAGPVHLRIKQFIISPKFKLKYEGDFKTGSVWYTNDDILNDGFHFNDIKRLVKIIHNENVLITNIAGTRALRVLEYE